MSVKNRIKKWWESAKDPNPNVVLKFVIDGVGTVGVIGLMILLLAYLVHYTLFR